jgi:hypothetical protein
MAKKKKTKKGNKKRESINQKKKNKKNQNKEKSKKDKYDKQTKAALLIMLILILGIFFTRWIINESKEIEYKRMTFYEVDEGGLIFYKAPLGFISSQGKNAQFILKLRNNPRKLDENIPIQGFGNINVKKNVTISVSPEIGDCYETYRTLLDFSRTLKGFGIYASQATPDKEFAKEKNISFANCENAIDKTVIIMQQGNKSIIKKDFQSPDCYIIEINNCEVQASFERFILGMVENMLKKN